MIEALKLIIEVTLYSIGCLMTTMSIVIFVCWIVEKSTPK